MNPELLHELEHIVGAHYVLHRLLDRLAYSRDASLYQMIPMAVVRPRTLEHIQELFRWCSTNNIHATFRAAGTSLSGQAVTDGLLIDISQSFKDVEVFDKGASVRTQMGITGGRLNKHLQPFGRKIGPDPASIQACLVGGIVANNSSGMCCGVDNNSYNTIESMIFVLPSGTTINTADSDANEQLLIKEPEIYQQLLDIKKKICESSVLSAMIRNKYTIKNTVGYSINAFLDEQSPSKILEKLMIGSEGTLGYIHEVIYRTVENPTYKLTCLAIFSNIHSACNAITDIKQSGAVAIELMDDASMHSFANLATTPEHLRFTQSNLASLLFEYQSESIDSIEQWKNSVQEIEKRFTDQLLVPILFTTTLKEQQQLWNLRKGLMPTLGAQRKAGTTMINEDIAVPLQHLAELITDLRELFQQYAYADAVIFGHANDGNIHFVVNIDCTSKSGISTYAAFMDAVAHVVVKKFGGSLKAEHGTGRNMAPFVEFEWGSDVYSIMCSIKKLIDPLTILSPNVVITDKPHHHIENIKHVGITDSETNACIECGFCEHVCPSTGFTLSPRQRISLRRFIHSGKLKPKELREIHAQLQYSLEDTCATDGMCSLVCPVGINTGNLVKKLRYQRQGIIERKLYSFAGRRFSTVNSLVVVSTKAAATVNRIWKNFPWQRALGSASYIPKLQQRDKYSVVYVPSCVSRWFGKPKNNNSIVDTVLELCKRAGVSVVVPDNCSELCCGQILSSRGNDVEGDELRNQTMRSIQAIRGVQSSTLVVTDTSSCGNTFAKSGTKGLHVLSPLQFMVTILLPKLKISKKLVHAIVHPGCALQQEMYLLDELMTATTLSWNIPEHAACCGAAGDRGIRIPELVANATQFETKDIKRLCTPVTKAYSLNTTCEAALKEQSGVPFTSLWYLLEEATRP